MVFTPHKRTSLRERVLRDLRSAILRGALPAGERIYEGKIAEQMEVSRAPVREALMALQQEGLVTRIPNKGVFVARLTRAELSEFYTLRSVLEEFAMELAIDQATEADIERLRERLQEMAEAAEERNKAAVFEADAGFHRALVQASHHALLLHFWRQVQNLLQVQYVTLFPVIYPLSEDIVARHQLLLDALLSGDPAEARAAIREHIVSAGERLIQEGRRQGLFT
ncbi:GntR family transcriptional regulator [Sphaerobacter sp.]|uniref:GntR family transcriptional regulator n=1 Tax=Sphaerobacter sp. TaxID=2099654 RepID=UPI001DA215E2|nr:GntR family transcriptional regulator [Sphaerobacter sp.]MBX5443833.1 GntR family transcriptional regulator [Sphaerobacter sp.]